MRKKAGFKKGIALLTAFALTATSAISLNPTSADAAAKKYVKSIKVATSKLIVAEGAKKTRKVTVKVKGKANKKVSVKSSDTSIASVKVGKPNKKGVSKITVTGNSEGTCKITVKTKGKNKKKKALSKKFAVTVTGEGSKNDNSVSVTATPTPASGGSSSSASNGASNTGNGSGNNGSNNISTVKEVTGLVFANSSVNMTVGDEKTIEAKVVPSDADNQKVTYSTDDIAQAVIELNKNTGTVTAVGAGMATVTATSNNGKTAQYVVIVKDPVIAVESVKISSSDDHFYANSKVQLSAEVLPINATDSDVSWKSSNRTGATVSTTGLVTCLKAGEKVTITATAGDKTDSLTFTVEEEPKKEVAVTAVTASISDLEKNSLGVYSIKEGQTAQINYSVQPSDATYQAVEYSVKDNAKAVTVSETGLVTAASAGNATVVVAVGGKTAELSFNVVPNEYSISLDKTETQLLSLKSGSNTSTLTATVVPSTENVAWTTTVQGIVDIQTTSTNSAKITAVKAGKTTIKATVGNKTATVDYVVTENDYIIMTAASGIAQGNYEFTVDVRYAFSEDSVTKAALNNSTLILTNAEDTSKVFTANFKSVNGDKATYTIEPSDFVVSGHYGELNGTYKLSEGAGSYLIQSETGLTVTYREKAYSERIAGRVIDYDTGLPIEDVEVMTKDGFTTTTDENGYYDVASNNGSSIEVTYKKDGYFDVTEETMVGSQRTSVINTEMELYDQTKITISGTVKALDYDGNDVDENGFTIELQAQNSDGDYQTIGTIESKTADGSLDTDTLSYTFGNYNADNLYDEDGAVLDNCVVLPEELSIVSSGTYRIIVKNGVDEAKYNPVYPETVKAVTTSATSDNYKVDLLTIRQIKPLAGLKIAANTFKFNENAEEPVNNVLKFTSVKLYATNGTKYADVLLAKKNNVTVETKAAGTGRYTNTSEINLLTDVFGTTNKPAEFELPATNTADNIGYYLVLEQAKNAYSVIEVSVPNAGSDITINSVDEFYQGFSGTQSAGFKYNVSYNSRSKSANAVESDTGYIYAIDGDYNQIGVEDDQNLKVDFDIYQVVNGIKIYLGQQMDKSLYIDTANAIYADGTFDKLSENYSYVVIPKCGYASDAEFNIEPGYTRTGSGEAVASVGKVKVNLINKSNLPAGGNVFVNSIKLVSSTDSSKVIATQSVNAEVQINGNLFSYDVSEEFTKIPAGTYKLLFDISGYEPLLSNEFTLYGFEQTDVTAQDNFKALKKTGVTANFVCDGQTVTDTLYVVLIDSDNKIAAAGISNNGSISLFDQVGGNDIPAGTYRIVARGSGYNTYSSRITLSSGVTRDMEEVELTVGARGTINLYATSNSMFIGGYDGMDITLRDGVHQASVDVTAYDNYYVPVTDCATITLRNTLRRWRNEEALGAYTMSPVSDTYYTTNAVISYGMDYNIEVSGDYLETTVFKAALSSNAAGTKSTLEDKIVQYKAPEKLTKLSLSYNVSGGYMTSYLDYVVLKNSDGSYNGTIELYYSRSNVDTRTSVVYIPTGFTGTVTVYSNGVTTGTQNLNDYNTISNLTVPLYALSNNN